MVETRWEIPLDRWDGLRSVLRDRLERSARLGHRIAYSNLVSGLPFNGPDSHALAEMLGELSHDSVLRGEPMISSLAVYISGEKQGEPGPGFYRAAIHLKRLSASATEEEKLIFWGREAEACFTFARPARRRPH